MLAHIKLKKDNLNIILPFTNNFPVKEVDCVTLSEGQPRIKLSFSIFIVHFYFLVKGFRFLVSVCDNCIPWIILKYIGKTCKIVRRSKKSESPLFQNLSISPKNWKITSSNNSNLSVHFIFISQKLSSQHSWRELGRASVFSPTFLLRKY